VIQDGRRLEDGAVVRADLCIVGAGPAGLTIARELAGGGLRICLLETGGLRGAGRAQELLGGESAGSPYPPLDRTRAAGFGGTSSIWTGGCRPLDPVDFEPRSWIPHSGWPLARRELDDLYERAAGICGVGSADHDPARCTTPDRPVLDLRSGRLRTLVWRLSPPVRFGAAFREGIARAGNVRVLLHAHALHLETGAGDRVAAVAAGTLDGGRFRVEARVFVLAAGGIENARLLLLSARGRGGLANAHDLVGRFFMEHPYVNAALLRLERPRSAFALYALGDRRDRRRSVLGVLALDDDLVRRERLVRCGFVFPPAYKAHAAHASKAMQSALELQRSARIRALPRGFGAHVRAVAAGAPTIAALALAKRADRGSRPPRFVARAFLEAVPDPDNRVTLGTRSDPFGRPYPHLRWTPGGLERRALRRAVEVLTDDLASAGIGRAAALPDDPATGWPASLGGGSHHIGTTRMSHDPRHGVVDPDGRLHGVPNVFVAGSSVFPTSGLANPTLTIVALALRLARHLDRTLGTSMRVAGPTAPGGAKGNPREARQAGAGSVTGAPGA
jgi:choline dehydrogenase-like flavoprotein